MKTHLFIPTSKYFIMQKIRNFFVTIATVLCAIFVSPLYGAIDNRQPSMALHYYIATEGVWPGGGSDGSLSLGHVFVGEVILMATDTPPAEFSVGLDLVRSERKYWYAEGGQRFESTSSQGAAVSIPSRKRPCHDVLREAQEPSLFNLTELCDKLSTEMTFGPTQSDSPLSFSALQGNFSSFIGNVAEQSINSKQ
jgi:hypothetical protein